MLVTFLLQWDISGIFWRQWHAFAFLCLTDGQDTRFWRVHATCAHTILTDKSRTSNIFLALADTAVLFADIAQVCPLLMSIVHDRSIFDVSKSELHSFGLHCTRLCPFDSHENCSHSLDSYSTDLNPFDGHVSLPLSSSPNSQVPCSHHLDCRGTVSFLLLLPQ